MKLAQPKISRGFWVWGFLFIFLLHAFAIFWLEERKGPAVQRQNPTPFLFLSSDEATDQRLSQALALHDPTLFSLPHAQGFSGGAWSQLRPPLPRLTNWSTPPEWLDVPTNQLGESLFTYVMTNRPSEQPLLSALREARAPDVRIPDQPVITRTAFKVEGTLAARKLVHVPELPTVTHSDLLRKTVLTVSVNGDGVVETATVASSSSLKSADALAVELTRDFEFEPLPILDARLRATAPRMIGQLVFTWQVVPPTNASPVTASVP